MDGLTKEQLQWSNLSDALRTERATTRAKAALRKAIAKEIEGEIASRDRGELLAEWGERTSWLANPADAD